VVVVVVPVVVVVVSVVKVVVVVVVVTVVVVIWSHVSHRIGHELCSCGETVGNPVQNFFRLSGSVEQISGSSPIWEPSQTVGHESHRTGQSAEKACASASRSAWFWAALGSLGSWGAALQNALYLGVHEVELSHW